MKSFKLIIIIFFTFLLLTSCSSDEDKLFKAVKKGNFEQVIQLVESGVPVTINDRNGMTPLDIARQNNKIEIAEYLYEQTKKVLDHDLEQLLKKEFSEKLLVLKNIEKKRVEYYHKYTSCNDSLMNSITADTRISEEIMFEQEKFFKKHQSLIKEFIDNKVDLIEDILNVFIDRDYISSIDSKDCRHIVNVNIMHKLSQMD